MIIAKNPQLKTEANNIKSMMLKHAYVEEKKVQLRSFHWNDRKEVTANVCIYKTDKGEYMHPIDMNTEMAKRFEKLEKYSGIYEPEATHLNSRSKQLQGLYAKYKAMPKDEVKRILKQLNKQIESVGRFGSFAYDDKYVIENLLNIH